MTPPRNRAWLLNLDADRELATVGHYTPPVSIQRQVHAQAEHTESLRQGEELLPYGPTNGGPSEGVKKTDHPTDGRPVFAWCPTHRAISWGGPNVIRGPQLSVLREANHRQFLSRIPHHTLGGVYLTGPDAIAGLLADLGTNKLRLKRAFGFAGKGQRSIGQLPSADAQRWITDSVKRLGLWCEAAVDITHEYSIHGYVDEEELWVGSSCVAVTDAYGAPASFDLRERMNAPMSDTEQQQQLNAAHDVAAALRSVGYFGPFGVDSFAFNADGQRVYCAASDVNARFTLAWSLGMGALRERALGRYQRRATRSPEGPKR